LALNDLLTKIAAADGPVSAKDVGVSAARMRELADDGLVERPKKDAVRKTGSKGRPAHLYRLTRKGRGRVQSSRNAQKSDRQAKAATKVAAAVTGAPAA
jgi:predicted ArsR family transcriptional regulator